MKITPLKSVPEKIEYRLVPRNTFFVWQSRFFFKGMGDVIGFHLEGPIAGDSQKGFAEDTLVVVVPHANVEILFNLPAGTSYYVEDAATP